MNNLDSDLGRIIPQLILIALLTIINGFFSAAEMAIVSVNRNKVKKLSEDRNPKAELLEKLIHEPNNFLSTIQIGITLAGFFSSASAATGISVYVSNIIEPLAIPYSSEISMIGVTIFLSYITLVFGELVPKRIALKKAESIALFSVKSIYYISIIAKPFIKILSISTGLVLKITGNNTIDIEEKVSEEEIRYMVEQCEHDGYIANDEKQMIYKVFQLKDRTAKEIMTSRKDTFLINVDDNIESILDSVLELNYSRIPVYEDGIDNIIGVLYVKDLMVEAREVGFNNIDIRKILNEPFFVPETKKTNELFQLLQMKKVHLALLFDEYGGFSGIVTMEDLIEEVMGEIEDEYDLENDSISKLDDKNFIVKGGISVNDFNDKFNINIETGDYDTLNGYLITALGEVPTEAFEIELNSIRFKVLKVENRRIEDIRVSFLN